MPSSKGAKRHKKLLLHKEELFSAVDHKHAKASGKSEDCVQTTTETVKRILPEAKVKRKRPSLKHESCESQCLQDANSVHKKKKENKKNKNDPPTGGIETQEQIRNAEEKHEGAVSSSTGKPKTKIKRSLKLLLPPSFLPRGLNP
jgi:hypothetical protein